MLNRAINFLSFILLMGVAGLMAVSCKGKSALGLVILTEKPVKLSDTVSGNGWHDEQCRIVSISADHPEGTLKILTDSFFSARSPQISYDGQHMLFTGKRKKDDTWQIWEMDLQNSKARKITSFDENSIDPVYLPGDRIAFSKSPAKDTIGAGIALYTCNLQGAECRQITFHPHDDFAAAVLADGRILAFSNQVYPVKGKPELFVLRPDGTKWDLFFNSNSGNKIKGTVWETADGLVYFIESDSLHPFRGEVVCIHQNSPFHTYRRVTVDQGDYQSVFPLSTGKLLVSYRNNFNEPCSLYECDPGTGIPGDIIYRDPDYSIMQVTVAEAHSSPRKLPSEVDMEVKTGLLMCQDINFRDQLTTRQGALKKATRIEVLGINTSFGVVNVEEDGSFYLKPMADIPIRIQTLDEKGKVVSGPGSWIWLRPNERRGCIGCHEDHEMAPENRVALAVRKPPVIIPIHITKVGEKDIELE
jgi:hypothetical protein